MQAVEPVNVAISASKNAFLQRWINVQGYSCEQWFLRPKGATVNADGAARTGEDVDLTGAWVSKYDEDKISVKLIVGGFWCDTEWRRKTGAIIGICGGTYTLTGDKYTEIIEYGKGYGQESAIGQLFRRTVSVKNDIFAQRSIENGASKSWSRAKKTLAEQIETSGE